MTNATPTTVLLDVDGVLLDLVLRTGVPLTAENAPRARVVECDDGDVFVWSSDALCFTRRVGRPSGARIADLIARGATVLAWRKP